MGKRSTVAMSERNENCSEGSVARYSATLGRCSRPITIVVSPLDSITSATDGASHSWSLRTGDILALSCDCTMSPIPDGPSLIPIERALFPEEDVTNQQNSNVEQHLHKAEHFKLVVHQRPWVQEDGLDIEQNKNQGHHVEVDGERLARVSDRGHPAFEGLIFCLGMRVFAHDGGCNHEHTGQPSGQYKHEQKSAVAVEVGAVHGRCAVIITSDRTSVK